MKHLIAATLALVGVLSLGACQQEKLQAERTPTFSITPSHQTILAGETVTFTAQSQNLIGRDAQLNWDTNGGEIQEQANGRVVRVTFPDPGTYTVHADLLVNGRRVDTAAQTVEVRPVR